MSSIGYDLDTSGGLMPLIRALIKPPDEEANGSKNKKPQHPYYKRPGKGHNHDSCDACGEGGDLICCDRCPASFHLGCYDPPLDENDIPAGLWLCKECHGSDEKEASSKGSRPQSPTENKPRSLRNKKKSKDSKDDEDEKKETEKELEKELTAMEILVRAARVMNPRQFELPPDMRVPCPFPGTDKEDSKNGNATLITVDSSGCVPLPAKSCYVCQGTCKMAPLLQCDYCPLLFHQDCLDPPLTALPTGRWMCPNHVEQYIDWKLVNSISASERVALWDRFSGPVDQHAIKIDFIRRARRAAPPFRVKVPVGLKGRVIVPDMVRYHYQNPPPLLPSRREHVRCRNVLQNLQRAEAYTEQEASTPKHTICLNLSCPQYKGGVCGHAADKLEGATEKDAKDDLEAIAEAQENPEDSSDSDIDFEHLTSIKRRKRSRSQDTTPAKRPAKLQLAADEDAAKLLAAVDEQLEKLDDRLVKLLAWQRLQQVLVGEQVYGSNRGAPISAAAERAVQRSIDRTRLAKFGFKHVALPSELLDRSTRDRISRAVWGGSPTARDTNSPHAQTSPASSPGHSLSDVAVRATLCVVLQPARNGLGDGLGRPIPMRLSRLTIGTCGACDVVLDVGKCRQVSPRHAVIFHDEVTRHFELINYSEWGSLVNGVLYTCDLSSPPAPAQDEGEVRAAAVRDVVRRRDQRPVKYARDRMQYGPVFGSKDYFHGLAIVLDTYSNHNGAHNHQHPYISAMVNNGTLHYDHDRDGTHTQLAGCEAKFRNYNHDTHISIIYKDDTLIVSTDLDGKNAWKECFRVEKVLLPTGYYFGASATTGDLSDNHDIISIKMYELDLLESQNRDEDRSHIVPSAATFDAPRDHVDDPKPAMSGIKTFLYMMLIAIIIIVLVVCGIMWYQKRQEHSRKRLY